MLDLKKYTEFHSPSYIIEIYNNGKQKEIVYGNRQTKPTKEKCNKDTLYDIASLTKVYTATLIYIAYEEKKLNLFDKVQDIEKRFIYLNQVRIIDLLSHNQEIWTDGYLGDAKTKEEFYDILYSSTVKSDFPTYLDTHYIILSTILEKIYNKPYEKLLKEKIFCKLNLTQTSTNPKGNNIASNQEDEKNRKILTQVHDTKARVAKSLGITTGHASIFTTGTDLLTFLKSFLDFSLLTEETIKIMLSHNNTNEKNYEILKSIVPKDKISKMYHDVLQKKKELKVMRTYNNMGVRYRNQIEQLNDVPNQSSKNTIVFSGYTGPSFLIDFDLKIIIIIMCNVLHNTKLTRLERKQNTDSIIEALYNSEIEINEPEILKKNIEKLHTTKMGENRIQKNLKLNTDLVVDYCKNKILDPNCMIYRQGKNWYCETENIKITINAYSYTIITAHSLK